MTRDIGGVITRMGDETIGEIWSRWDGKDIFNETDPCFDKNIERQIRQAIKDDRSKAPQDQDPDMLVHLVKETDAGIVIRCAKYGTAAAYSNQAFLEIDDCQLGQF